LKNTFFTQKDDTQRKKEWNVGSDGENKMINNVWKIEMNIKHIKTCETVKSRQK
jgi:hypothetical protein